METLEQFIIRHKQLAPQDGQRLGQRFFNEFYRSKHEPRCTGDVHSWAELFYQRDDAVAERIIKEWLERLQYLPHVPSGR